MFPNCKNCPVDKCVFIGHTVETALNACQLLPLKRALQYLDSLSDKQRNAIVLTRPGSLEDQYNQDPMTRAMGLSADYTKDMLEVMRANPWPFTPKMADLDSEMIARKSVYGKDTERLNLN